MLQDSVKKIKKGNENYDDFQNEWSPQLNLNVSSLIPKTYVSDLDIRLSLYRKLSKLKDKIDIEKFAAELIDRFGDLPKEIHTLMNVVHIKNKCKKINIEKIDANDKNIILKFYNNKFSKPESLIKYVQNFSTKIKVKNNKLIYFCESNDLKEKFKNINKVLKEIENLL